ncbi:MAG: ATP-binding protein [Opitutae bacterium]|nr:ATP-binding protein [Opitutae bacterium]
MNKKSVVGRRAELDGIRNGLSAGGSAKGFLFIGKEGIGKSTLLQESWREISQVTDACIWIAPNFSNVSDEIQAATSLARGIDSSSSELSKGLSSFARAFGQKAFELERELTKSEAIENISIGKELSEHWLANFFEALPIIREKDGSNITIVLVIDDLGKLAPKVVNWLANDFFPKWDDAGMTDRTRCIFAADSPPVNEAANLVQSACGNRTIPMKLRPLRASECAEIAISNGASNPDGEKLRALSEGNPGKLHQILKNDLNRSGITHSPMNATEENTTSSPSLDGLPPEETEYLFRAAYLPVFSKDSLGLFCNPRQASLTFNWIKNAGNLAEAHPGNRLALRQEVQEQARSLHSEIRPEESVEWASKAEAHLSFEEHFPNPTSRWVPIRLSNFQFFDKKVMVQLFGADDAKGIIDFVDQNTEFFEDHSGYFKFRPDVMEVVNRFKTASSLTENDDDLSIKISEIWLKRKSECESKRNEFETERDNVHSEINGIDKKIDTLNGLKKNLLESFLNPQSRKPQREISLSVAPVLLVLGLATIGISLALRDLFGPYHAAAGIALSLFGFFWPTIKMQSKQQFAETGGIDRFAIETQQRMLGQKLLGLNTRKGRLRISLEKIDEGIEKIDVSLQQPYASHG